uniref:Uncharacterized protein n=2 Tax=Leersia perrieri TaxID=77586 RepID=A0A0D9W4X4_9ORYZ
MGAMRRRVLPLLLCCSLAAVLQPSRALFHSSQLRGGVYGEEEKVPMAVVVSNYSPRPAPFGAPAPAPEPSPAPALPPLPGSDSGGGDMPTLPSERRSGRPSGGNGGAGAPSPAAAAGETSTAFISSSPAVPLPAGVTDSATVLPMPTPGQQQQVVGMGTLLVRARAVQQIAVPLAMMLFFSALWIKAY